ncbi:MAG: dihydrodipicolinate synthase family protein [Chloroflexota bacterium]|nr:dihydrodipicolinate synthase family protein [Chloroflexota bacterium]
MDKPTTVPPTGPGGAASPTTAGRTPAAGARWRGIFTIPVTPFHEDMEIDVDSLRSQLDFCVEAGAAGIVHPVMASEFFTLSDEERLRLMPVVTRQVNGRLPVVIGVAATGVQGARALASAARDAGADAVIAMPPYITKFSPDDVLRYFTAIAEAAGVPVFIQNAGVTAMTVATLLKLVREVPGVHYVKEEVAPAHHNIARLMEAADPLLWGVFGGGGAQNLLDELRRGAAGNMPASQYTDVVSRVFTLWEQGDERAARDLHTRLQPAMQRERLSGVASAKAILVRRGIIKSARTRGAGTPLDDFDRAELDALWPQLQELFTWKG